MHPHIEKLYRIAGKESRLILGLMSGTSFDGLDMALCRFSGSGLDTKIELLHFTTASFDASMKEEIKSVFSKEAVNEEKLCLLHPWIALQHAQLINDTLQQWGVAAAEVDLLASHGQTVYHAPKALHQKEKFGNATLQIGDGDHLAVATGIITLSDFRQKHIAAGGEGAPLAVYGDYLIFSKAGEDRIMLNMGGIANYTFLSGDVDANKVFSTDTGPGNTIMDAFMQKHFPGQFFDEDGRMAKQGSINQPLLYALKKHPFFQQGFPKTTGPELFNLAYLDAAIEESGMKELSPSDILATLCRFTAETITEAIQKTIQGKEPFVVYASGGGMHNPVVMQHLRELLPGATITTTTSLGIDPDAKEAVLFAILANECVCGKGTRMGNARAGIPSVTMGKISFPD